MGHLASQFVSHLKYFWTFLSIVFFCISMLFSVFKISVFFVGGKNKDFYVPLQGCKNNALNDHKLASWRPITLSWSLLRENASNERFDPKVDPKWESEERIVIVKQCVHKTNFEEKKICRKKSSSEFQWWTNHIVNNF